MVLLQEQKWISKEEGDSGNCNTYAQYSIYLEFFHIQKSADVLELQALILYDTVLKYYLCNLRSAKEAEENIKKALKKGETLPDAKRFDSNCITPGIERLQW